MHHKYKGTTFDQWFSLETSLEELVSIRTHGGSPPLVDYFWKPLGDTNMPAFDT